MGNPPDDTVTRWIRIIRNQKKCAKDYQESMRLICNEFVPAIVRIICRIIPKKHRWIVSPDGIANESLNDALRFVDASDVDQYWSRVQFLDLCLRIASNNVADDLRSLKCSKRGGDSASVSLTRELAIELANRNNESNPASASEYCDLLERFMQSLPTDLCREVVSMKLQGHSTIEIASFLGIINRTVNRKIATARRILRKLVD